MGLKYEVSVAAMRLGLALGLLVASAVSHAQGWLWPDGVSEEIQLIRNDPQEVITSLKPRLESPSSKEVRASYHYALSRAYSALVYHEKALNEADNGLALISSAAYPALYHYLQLARAEALDGGGNAQSGLRAAVEALKWAQTMNDNNLTAYALSVNGYLRLTLSQMDEALSFFQSGYKLVTDHPLHMKPADFASMIALVYEYRHEPATALPYFKEAEDYFRKEGLILELANTRYGLARAYISMDNPERGLPLLEDSARLALQIGDVQGAAYSYKALADYYIDEGNFTRAVPFLHDALARFKESDNPFMQIGVLLSLARIDIRNGQNENAQRYVNRAAELAKGDSFSPHKIQINNLKSKIYAANGDFETAYLLLTDNQLAESNYNKEQNSRRLLELRTEFEVERQKAKNALLEEQNLRQQTEITSRENLQTFTIAIISLLIVICLLLLWLYANGKRHRARLELLANEDELTGLLSRRKALGDIEQQLQLAHRHKECLTLAVLDLDHFKRINDTFGHQAGDDVLSAFGELAKDSFRSTDILGRIGGEEFVFAFPHATLSEAKQFLEKFAQKVKGIPDSLHYKGLNTSVSVGIVTSDSADNSTNLISHADEALYQAKERGRDQIVLYRSEGPPSPCE